MRKVLEKIFQLFNLGLVKYSRLDQLKEFQKDILLLFESPKNQFSKMIEIKDKSKAELKQDLFVLLETNFMKKGFFVEFGAANGLDYSNTWLLEKEYEWNGILAEPGKIFHQSLKKNRSCHVDYSCVWSESNFFLDFVENEAPTYSVMKKYKNFERIKRKQSKTYQVETISLSDLLKKHNAPKKIEYLSIDTEGSEFDILNNFNFSEYEFKVITCEHNFNKNRDKIHNLLSKNGYIRKYTGFSDYDDWFIKIN